MSKPKLRLDNTRTPEQLRRMKRLANGMGCFFCKDNYLEVGASPAIHRAQHWYIKKNDFPYEGTLHHYLIVPKRHITKITEITPGAWSELSEMVKWLDKLLKIKGYSILARTGDMKYTGATLDHLHFHLVSGAPKKKDGELKDNVRFTLAHKSTRRQHS